jgi:hypothetical protein
VAGSPLSPRPAPTPTLLPSSPAKGAPMELSPRMKRLCAAMSPLVDGMIKVWTEVVDRRAPMPLETVDMVNAVLHQVRRILGREPGEALLTPLPLDGTMMPADGYVRLMQARYLLDRLIERHGRIGRDGEIEWKERNE